MKQQKMPPNGLKLKQVLYKIDVYVTVGDKVVCNPEEWVIRTHRAKRGSKSRHGREHLKDRFVRQGKFYNLTNRIKEVTWGYVKGKGQWLAAASKYDLQIWDESEVLPRGYYTTLNKAYLFAIEEAEDTYESAKRYVEGSKDSTDADEIKEDAEYARDCKRELAVVKARYKKYLTANPPKTKKKSNA